MQMTPDADPLRALPELLPPPDLDSSVLELALSELDQGSAVAEPERTPPVSGFEVFVHGTLVAAYVVYAAHAAFGLLARVVTG
jgi:hypothetical protein